MLSAKIRKQFGLVFKNNYGIFDNLSNEKNKLEEKTMQNGNVHTKNVEYDLPVVI